MKSSRFLAPVALCLAALLASAAPAPARDLRTIDQVYPLDRATGVRIEIAAGKLRIEPSPDRRLRASVTLKCRRWDGGCERRAKDVEWVGNHDGGRFVLKLEGMPRRSNPGLTVDAVLQVPRDLELSIALGAGQVGVHDLEKDVRVALGAGQVNVFMREDRVGSVGIDVGLGDARLRRSGRRIPGHGWLGHTLRWTDGPGTSRVRVQIGVGDGEVDLQ